MRRSQAVSRARPCAGLAGLVSAGLALTLSAPCANAQSYLVHTYTVDRGLPSVEVSAIAQAGDGRMWFATRKGVLAFDGTAWEDMSSGPLEGTRVQWLARDPGGGIWTLADDPPSMARTVDGECERFTLPLPEGATVTGFEVAAGADRRVQVAVATRSRGLLVRRNGSWRRIDSRQGLPGDSVHGLVAWNGNFYVATDGGPCVIADGHIDPSLIKALAADVRDVAAIEVSPATSGADDPDVWILSGDRLYRLREGMFRPWGPRLELGPSRHRSPVLRVARALNLISVGTVWKTVHLDLTTGLSALPCAGGSSLDGSALDLFVDREQCLWMCNRRGITKLVSRRFATYRRSHGLLEDEVSAICEPRPGTLVLGHNGGVSVLEDETFRQLELPLTDREMLAARVMDMVPDGRGGMWIAASEAGLCRLDPAGNGWCDRPGDGPVSISALVDDPSSNSLLIGGSALYRYAGGRFSARSWDLAELGQIRRLLVTRSGALLAATNLAGVVAIRDDRRVVLTAPRIPGAQDVFTLAEDAAGNVWAGTRAGLLRLEGNEMRPPRAPELAGVAPVYTVIADAAEDLWLGTDDGVVRWDGGSARHFRQRDGFAGNETNRAAALVDSSGRLWIGADNGLSRYQPEHDVDPPAEPLVELTAIDVDGVGHSPDLRLTIAHHHHAITFQFRALSFRDEDAVRYQYRLDGFDDGWSTEVPASQRSARYTSLRPGTYRFWVRAARSPGTWSTPTASDQIRVRGPLWTRWWVLLGAGLVVAAAVAAGLRTLAHWRRTQEALRDSEAKQRALLEAIPDLMFVIRSDGTFVDYRARDPRDLLAPADQLLGRSVGDALPPWLAELTLDMITKALASGAVQCEEYQVDIEDSPRFFEARVVPAGPDRVLALIRDQTREKRLEDQIRQTQKMEALGQLAAGIAHDFNNLLQAILMTVELLRRRSDTPEAIAGEVDSIIEQCRRGATLIRQILDFSRASISSREPLEIGAFMEDFMPMLIRTIPEKVRVTYHRPEDRLEVVADPARLQQVITNLAVNARDAMPHGGTLEIDARRRVLPDDAPAPSPNVAPGTWIEIRFSDTGVGIPSEHLPRVFEPFFTTRERGKGTGLGLAQVYGIVADHGGVVDLSSTQGEGTAVVVLLPERPPDTDPEPERAPSETRRGGQGEAVLVVEDDPSILEVLTQGLSNVGYRVVAARDGVHALELYSADRGDIALVVADVVMPRVSGPELARRLRAVDPDLRLVLMSGYPLGEEDACGAAHWLQKPFSLEDLAEVVERALGE